MYGKMRERGEEAILGSLTHTLLRSITVGVPGKLKLTAVVPGDWVCVHVSFEICTYYRCTCRVGALYKATSEEKVGWVHA